MTANETIKNRRAVGIPVATPEDINFCSPTGGGCFLCSQAIKDGEESTFSIEWDADVHIHCAWRSVLLPQDQEADVIARETFPDYMEFVGALSYLGRTCHAGAASKGFWDHDRNDGEMIALVHSELSEALEAIRDGNPESEKIAPFSHAEEEFADAIIRMADQAHARGWDLGRAVVAKLIFNTGRLHRHGGKRF